MKSKIIAIAGKNNIACSVLRYANKAINKYKIVAIPNNSDTGESSWQESFRNCAQNLNIDICDIQDVYNENGLVFISLEYNKIIDIHKFKSKNLYNIHFSLLPSYKGMYTSALPILYGEVKTGVTLHKIDRGIDTGDIILQKKICIEEDMTALQLYLKYLEKGSQIIKRKILMLAENDVIDAYPQSYINSSYYSRDAIDYRNVRIDLNKTAMQIKKQIQAYNFRYYQLPIINGKSIVKAIIKNERSFEKPGKLLYEDKYKTIYATIDYNIEVYFDYLNDWLVACGVGDFDTVKKLKNNVSYIDEKNIFGHSGLIIACKNNQIEVVKYLLSLGANVYDTDFSGRRVLEYAREGAEIKNDVKSLELILKSSKN